MPAMSEQGTNLKAANKAVQLANLRKKRKSMALWAVFVRPASNIDQDK